MNSANISILNEIIATLIDSREGYETCRDLIGQLHPLNAMLHDRINERQLMIEEMQHAVELSGGQPQTVGGVVGTIHRSVAQFVSMFREDEQTALLALQDGEDYLVRKLEKTFADQALDLATRRILKKALTFARNGEHLVVQFCD